MPAEKPPMTRATNSTSSDGAYAASREAGMDRIIPSTSRSLRP